MTDMNYEAMAIAGAYAWGREDASGTRTVSPTDAPGSLTFAEAWGRRKAAFDREDLFYMPSIRDAYDGWQESGGRPAWANLASQVLNPTQQRRAYPHMTWNV